MTEFLPISSTGHLILASSIMNISEDAFVKTFDISIQIGAIMAIVLLYVKRFLKGISRYLKLGIAFIPTGIIGILAYPYIKAYLFDSAIVTVSLILGGIVLILIRWHSSQNQRLSILENLSLHKIFVHLPRFYHLSILS